MEGIEADYESLRGVLPKAEYHKIANADLGELLRRLNPEELKTANGDIFGRIYEYFLTQFADQGAHDGGEFFTPISLVQMIVNLIEPLHGKVLDPACGSGGMFVQSAHLVERNHSEPGRCAIWKDEVPGMMIQKALHRIRPNEELDYRFLFYSFLLKGRNNEFSGLFTGSTIKHLPGQNLAKVVVSYRDIPGHWREALKGKSIVEAQLNQLEQLGLTN